MSLLLVANHWIIIVLLVLAVLLVQFIIALFVGSYTFVRNSLGRDKEQPPPYPACGDLETIAERYVCQGENARRLFLQMAPEMEHWFCKSFDGLTLHGWFLACPGATRCVILCPGYHGALGQISPYLAYFARQKNCHCLMVDIRAHGVSEGTQISMGVNESRDLLSWHRLAQERLGSETELLYMGWSMGGSSVLLAAAENQAGLVGVVADSGYTNICDLFLDSMKARPYRHLLKKWLLYYIRRFRHVDLRQANALKAVKSLRVPVLFIHGTADETVPVKMGQELYAAAPQPKSLCLIPDAEHVRSMEEDPLKCQEALDRFWAETTAVPSA